MRKIKEFELNFAIPEGYLGVVEGLFHSLQNQPTLPDISLPYLGVIQGGFGRCVLSFIPEYYL